MTSPSPFPHWMLREMYEQPDALSATLNEYVSGERFRDDTCAPVREWIRKTEHELVIVASGSSRHAGLVAEILLEDLSGLPTDVEYASEYVYRSESSLKHASILVLSQSGETADTLAALRRSSDLGRPTLAITNVVGSSMARDAMAAFPTLAGREQAVPATKSFTSQLLQVYLLALLVAESRGALSSEEISRRLQHLAVLPELISEQLAEWERVMRVIAAKYAHASSFLFLGRGLHYPIAREGALKLKESAYLHAEGYPAGELKHGPNALVSETTPLVMIATVDRAAPESVARYERIVQLLEDMRRQGANTLTVANEGDQRVGALSTNTVFVREATEPLLAICEVIPLQLFSYFAAVQSGINVDSPRNLSKAVLVE